MSEENNGEKGSPRNEEIMGIQAKEEVNDA